MAAYTETKNDTETFEVEQEIDFAYDVEISINDDREIVEPLLAESFPRAKFHHHDWDGNSFSAWLLMINESGLRIRVNYGVGGLYIYTAVEYFKSFIF